MRLPRVLANEPPPPIHWWGNAFYRVWMGWQQLVIVIRLPWWRETVVSCAQDWDGADIAIQQLVISWRAGEGWRYGWRANG